jgi:hypothetical protein
MFIWIIHTTDKKQYFDSLIKKFDKNTYDEVTELSNEEFCKKIDIISAQSLNVVIIVDVECTESIERLILVLL